ncbi:MAG: hypothetical protein IPN51_17495 [Chloracidobacterium sp.]|nr:hypothetical protein [Chloracidobacterium sp.]
MRGTFQRSRRGTSRAREMLDLLNYRHSLVSKRTSVVNQLQAFARSKGLATVPFAGGKGEKEDRGG